MVIANNQEGGGWNKWMMDEKHRPMPLVKTDLGLMTRIKRFKKGAISVGLALLLAGALKISGFEYSEDCLITRIIAPQQWMTKLDGRWWKLSGGDPVASHSDVLSFSRPGNCSLVDDILYVNSRPVARVLRLEHRFFMDYELTVTGLENGKLHYYNSK